MCGIAGVWGSQRSAVVDGMLEQLVHRGPDAEGMSPHGERGLLGHRRLSIVDIDGGNQPFVHGAATLVANGEIYNAETLRADLDGRRAFSTRSDNEVILHLLDEEGPPAVDRLLGMFAFALAVDDELLLARDPLGIKPLYVGRLDDDTVFGSELRSFPPGTTGVVPIAPGTIWSDRHGSHRYYEVPDPEPAEGDLASHAERVRQALDASVQRHLMSDVPIGAFLSGGLDSSAIVALMAQHVDEFHTFSVGLPGSPDLAAARVVAEHVGTVHHEYVLEPEEILDELPAIVAALESFDQDLVRSAVPTFFTARLAAQHVKVVMTGEGADELFAGYTYQKDLATDAAVHADARRSLADLHHVNLQRVDRLTMAHSLEARVPFIDVEMIDTALSIPAALRRPGVGAPEKAVLRHAVHDLLPATVVWRDKAQFDESSGTADLLPKLSIGWGTDIDTYQAAHPGTVLRSAEEGWYHQMLIESAREPAALLANVARWSDR